MNMVAAAYKALVTLLGADSKRVALFTPSNLPDSGSRFCGAFILKDIMCPGSCKKQCLSFAPHPLLLLE